MEWLGERLDGRRRGIPAGQQLGGDGREPENIEALGDRCAGAVLGGTVARRTRAAGGILDRSERSIEVRDVDIALSVNQQVGRLHVAMDDPLTVEVGERRTDLADDLAHPFRREGPFDIGETPTAEERHHEVGAFAVAPEIEQRDDVRMRELRHQACLRLEGSHELRVIGVLRPDHLHGHLASHGGLVGPTDDTEPSRADLLAKLVTANGVAEVAVALAHGAAGGKRRTGQRRVVLEDAFLELSKLG